MSPKSAYSREAEAADQRTDVLAAEEEKILSRVLKRLGLPASLETFTKNIYRLLETLAFRLALAELCLKEGKNWKAYNKEIKRRGL